MQDVETLKAISTLAAHCQMLEAQSNATERMLAGSIIIPDSKVNSIIIGTVLVFGMLIAGGVYMFTSGY